MLWLENASDESPIRRQGFTIPTTSNNPFLKLRSFFWVVVAPLSQDRLGLCDVLGWWQLHGNVGVLQKNLSKGFQKEDTGSGDFFNFNRLRVKWWQTSIDGSLCLLPFGCLGAKLPLIRLSSYPSSSGSTGGPQNTASRDAFPLKRSRTPFT